MQLLSETKLLQALQWRYATKIFDPNRKIPAETWKTLQEALMLSASAFGLQPYRFILINDPAMRSQLMPHAWNQRQVVDASHFLVFAARTAITEMEIDHFLDQIVKIRGVKREALANYRQLMMDNLLATNASFRIPHWTARQVYIALGNLLTCAALVGVDTCPIEGFAPDEFDKLLGLPAQGYAAVVCCALGYRSPEDKHAAARKVRFPAEELFMMV